MKQGSPIAVDPCLPRMVPEYSLDRRFMARSPRDEDVSNGVDLAILHPLIIPCI